MNSVFFNEYKDRTKEILKCIRLNLDRRKKYNLYLASCYLADNKNLHRLVSFILEISEICSLSTVSIYIDARQVIKTGVDEIKSKIIDKLKESLSTAEIAFYAVDGNRLFHTKALILQSCDANNGLLFIGSTNFSMSGLLGQSGNYESLIFNDNLCDIQKFIDSMSYGYLKLKTLEDLEDFGSINNFTFQYAVLQQGYFVHKWQQTIQQYFSVKYKLSPLGQEQISSGRLKEVGFSADVETISRQYLKFEAKYEDFEVTERLNNLRRQGIETYLGHWVPECCIPSLNFKEHTEFIEKLEEEINKQLSKLNDKMQEHFEFLKNENFIAQDSREPAKILEEKLNSLKNDNKKIEQFMYRFEIFELPYDFSDKEKIIELYEHLVDVSHNRKKKNIAMKNLLSAVDSRNPLLVNELVNDEDN